MDNDRAIFRDLMHKLQGQNAAGEPAGKRLLRVACFFMGRPFAARPLEHGKNESLVVNLREFDCFTFVENCVVLAWLLKSGKTKFSDYTAALEAVRYRRGRRNGYASRLHYFTDWLEHNQLTGMLVNLTRQLGGEPWHRRIDFMTAHRADYPALAQKKQFARMLAVEAACSQWPLYQIPKANLPAVAGEIEEGDLLAITTAVEGLDVSHVGFAVRTRRGLHLLHSSQQAGKVTITDRTLHHYLQQRKARLGIMVARLQ